MARGGGNRSRLLLVLLLVSSLFLITLDLRGINLAGSIRSGVSTVISPVENLFSRLLSPVGSLASDVRNFGQSKKKIAELSKQVDELKAKQIIDEDTVGQLNQLKNVLDLAGRGGYKVVSARVINRGSTESFKETLTIDVGSSDGISRNMTVISESGLVGVIKSVGSNSSIVLLMSDPTFKIGVRIAGTQSIGVVSGQGGSTYLLQLLDATGEIKVGDTLVARGSQDGRPFVPGVPVGTVTTVQSNASSITKNADVASMTNLEKLSIVAVVITPPTGDPRDSLVPKPRPTATVYITPSPTPTPSR
ncbi:MAG: rod shape-determining protein MreC [Actinobacteria bacterium]|nr:rod shape-determining protein MreC [Actinomycetota bacterium]